MRFPVRGAPHVPAPTSVSGVMGQVLLALIPGVAAYLVYFGPGILIQITLAVGAALLWESAVLSLRKRPVRPALGDLSAVVTAVLYALCLPPLLPWWAALVGMFFAIVVAKHLYGGLGNNLFNPAMIGYVVILVSFPREATSWLPPAALSVQQLDLGETLTVIFSGSLPDWASWDAITRATPLDRIKTAATQDIMLPQVLADPIFGRFGGMGWEPINLCFAVGGIWLLYRRVAAWQVPVAMLGTVLVVALSLYILDQQAHPFPLYHIFTGGMILGAFFIATDPVSGATSPRGRLLFGAGVAIIALAIRRWGGYPDGVAFAVLIMNLAAPLIDQIFKTRTYGR